MSPAICHSAGVKARFRLASACKRDKRLALAAIQNMPFIIAITANSMTVKISEITIDPRQPTRLE
jgi:hypothetical protein